MLKKYYLTVTIICILLASLIFITGCSNKELANIPNVSDYNLSLSVTDENDNPIEGASVTLDGSSKTTDNNGIVTFSKPDGSYDYNVKAAGYDTIYDTIIVNSKDLSVNVPMTILINTYNINFTVTDSSDNPIANATITLDGEGKNTDSNGMATFSKQDGTYNYDIKANEYVEVTNQNITVNGTDISKTVDLKKTPPSGYIGIYDWEDLDNIRNDLNGDYILMNDLDSNTIGYKNLASSSANEGKGWAPIGIPIDAYNLDGSFTGEFDGNNKIIADLEINRPDSEEKFTGLFGYIHEGTIKDLKSMNFNIIGYSHVGAIAGINDGGNIVNSNISDGSINGVSTVGGLVGHNFNAITTSNCYSKATVQGNNRIGGLVGYNESSYIEKSYATGNVSGDSECGGLVGKNNIVDDIESCYYDSETTGQSDTGKGSPRTTKQMQEGTANTTIDGSNMYTDWDTTIWDFGSDSDYPSLSWE